MATYRVGEAGATVFNKDGKALVRLRPGYVAIEGTLDTARLPDADSPKRQRYADKKLRPGRDIEDKSQ